MPLPLIAAAAGEFLEAALVRMGATNNPIWIRYVAPYLLPVLRYATQTKVGQWVTVGIAGLSQYGEDALDSGRQFIAEIIREYLQKVLRVTISELDKESVKLAIGESIANEIKIVYKAKIHRDFLIDNVYPVPEFLDNLGIFLAQEANSKIGEPVFTTLYPYNNVRIEAETYLINKINGELGTQLTDLEPQHIKDEIQRYLIEFVEGLVQGGIEEAIGLAKDQIDTILDDLTGGGIELSAYQKIQMQNLVLDRLAQFTDKVNNNFSAFLPITSTQTSAKKRRARRLSRRRQKRWRESHVQQTVWVAR